ncbi:MAG: 1,4-dihydroxy-2-naphthoyl-CoA synthase [Desulfobacteraceae bacterium]|jgi:naphthoate synthase|nr:MAG: 1,4-dihydroxy-2-naphthoyl-CoA synthase [Desulfobacteraceae bacterium]
MDFAEIIYEKREGIARLTINRPERYNAFTALTLEEIYLAFRDAWADKSVGVVVLTGAGEKAFCTGGDQKTKDADGYGKGRAGFELLEAHGQVLGIIRAIPKPVIAAVNGYAIGGGHILHLVCDLTIASENARFGQAGPRVGSFDAGFGTIYLARIVGEKKAREIWYLCRQYSAREALEMGLVNRIVPHGELNAEVEKWARELLQKSPTSLAFIKASFNVDSDHAMGVTAMSGHAVNLYYQTEESHEGVRAFLEKRPPDFSRFRK